MKNFVRFALIISFFGFAVLFCVRVGNTASQGLTLNLTEPADRSCTNQTMLTVACQVNPLEAIVTANGTELAIAADNTFRGTIPLPNEGSNTIEFRATGEANAVVTTTCTIFRDTIAPTLQVSQPDDGSTVSTSQIEIKGSAADASPFSITVNGLPAKIDRGLWSMTISLTEGRNLVRVEATDAAGNQSDNRLLVYLETTPRPPLELEILSPRDRQVTNQARINVSGTVSDPEAHIVLNGQSLENIGFFGGEITLTEGPNSIRVVAMKDGNQAEVIQTVFLDTVPPVLQITSPQNGQVICASATDILGTVTDASDVVIQVDQEKVTVPHCDQPGGCPFVIHNVQFYPMETVFRILARIFHEVGRPWVFHFGNPWLTLKINQKGGNEGVLRVFSGFCQSSETPPPSPFFVSVPGTALFGF